MDDRDLGLFFEISEDEASDVSTIWINFLFFQLREVNIWPARDVVQLHMPGDFRERFPMTRVILGAAEFPIQKPSDGNIQGATFSKRMNKDTLKCLVGCSPIGAVTFISDVYGGGTSNRKIFKRSILYTDPTAFEHKDSILADSGIKIQDLMAPKGVFVNTPNELKRKKTDSECVVREKREAFKYFHVEKVIALAKTYEILRKELPEHMVDSGSRIIPVCFMLINFRTRPLGKDA